MHQISSQLFVLNCRFAAAQCFDFIILRPRAVEIVFDYKKMCDDTNKIGRVVEYDVLEKVYSGSVLSLSAQKSSNPNSPLSVAK